MEDTYGSGWLLPLPEGSCHNLILIMNGQEENFLKHNHLQSVSPQLLRARIFFNYSA